MYCHPLVRFGHEGRLGLLEQAMGAKKYSNDWSESVVKNGHDEVVVLRLNRRLAG
jgi:hypothetical protein